MAKKNNDKQPKQPGKISLFFKSEMTYFFMGLFLLLFSIFLSFSFLSFLFTGAYDQSFVENRSLIDVFSLRGEIRNWTGALGAYLSDFFINKGFGISSFIMLLFAFQLALSMMKVKSYPLMRNFVWAAVAMIWGSVLFALIMLPFSNSSFLYLGGAHGLLITEMLQLLLGIPGTILLILGVSLFLAALRNKNLIEKFRSVFFYRFKRKEKTPTAAEKDEEEETNIGETPETVSPSGTIHTEVISHTPEKEDKSETEETLPDKNDYFDDDFAKVPVNNDFLSEEEFDIPATGTKGPQVSIEKAKPAGSEFAVEINAAEPEENEEYNGADLGEYDPTLDLSRYKYPQADLLRRYDDGETAINEEEQNTNIRRIRETLEHYGITISSIKATVGPTITLYEIVPAPGIRISKIRNLEDDIALSLAALGIRIIAPIPGKGTVGIEVPNKDPQIVSMQSIIASKKFNESKYDLPIALGKTITNEIFMVDLCKMPHVLVAGATGQGKSVGLNAIITSLLYKKHPSQLKFVLVDPKKVEFNIYSMIEKHFLAKLPDAEEAIITDVTKVVQTLNSITREMDQRYDLLKKAHTRNIKEYNAKFIARKLNPENGHRYMPYIVVIIDEFGDLIMTAGKEVELPIARIAQLARAVGIHMVIATQRPSTNIITGTIKANFPARVAFRVSSMIDSRTILDCPGANQLIGRGDLLFSQGSDLIRVQCAFVDTPEVEQVAEYIGNQQGYPTAFLLPEYEIEAGEGVGQIDMNDRDPLFEEAARLIVANQQGSTSLLQRKMSLGYNRAGRIMDQLEATGIVGPFEGSKARQVLVIDETHLEMVLSNLR